MAAKKTDFRVKTVFIWRIFGIERVKLLSAIKPETELN